MAPERGFTLIEVMVALTIGALVVLVAERLFASVSDAGRTLVVARTALDREMNARRWLDATFRSLEIGPGDAGPFEGHRDRVAFSSWLETPGGWFERRRITLAQAGDSLVATITPGASVVLADSVTSVALDYLMASGEDARWMREWVSLAGPPLAVRLRIARGTTIDTLLLPIGERG